jgi:hypothetical protein
MDDCPNCRRNALAAATIRGIADTILMPVNTLARLPPGTTQAFVDGTTTGAVKAAKVKGVKRKASAYSKEYKRAFKRVSKNYRKKDGAWKKDGFKRAVKAAHKSLRK